MGTMQVARITTITRRVWGGNGWEMLEKWSKIEKKIETTIKNTVGCDPDGLESRRRISHRAKP